MPTVVDLARPGPEAFTIIGESGSGIGRQVSAAGDVNGDGLDDVIISNGASSAYVVYGRASGLDDIDLDNLQASEGFKITSSYWNTIGDVSAAGDVNGDGFDDVLVGGAYYYGWYGIYDAAWVIFGTDQQPGPVNVSSMAESRGSRILGVYSGEEYGPSVGAAGDVNGDGFDDFIIGSPYARGTDGDVYVVFGKSSGFAGLYLGDLEPDEGFRIMGKTGAHDYAGLSVSGAGDVNGDGFADIIIGAPYAAGGGQAFVIFGKAGGFDTIDLSNVAASAGFVIQGAAAGDYAGFSVSAAGDFNGDGYDDVLVGAPDADNNHALAGEAYVIFGKANGFGPVNLSNLAAGAGFAIYGDDTADHAGFSVSAAGDVNNDGYDDIIIGAPENDNSRDGVRTIDAGEAYVIYGRASGFGTIDLTNLSSADGLILQGAAAGDLAGSSVSGAGDVDGDGFDDLIVGAPHNDRGGSNAGAAYVISGQLKFADDVDNDFNGDGRSDVMWRNDGGQFSVWAGQADGSFVAQGLSNSTLSLAWQVVGSGDFNGDGRGDVLWRHSTGAFGEWLGLSSGGFVANSAADAVVGTSWSVAATGDFNGDNYDDVIWRDVSGAFMGRFGRADGGFNTNAFSSTTIATSWYVVGAGDFNGDGRDDVLWRNDKGATSVWAGQANGGFVAAALSNSTVSTSWHISGTGDFNGDGKDDILWHHDNGAFSVWSGLGNGGFVASPNSNTFIVPSWHIAGTGDYNGDNRDDVLWRNDNGAFSVWNGLADGGFVASPNSNTVIATSWHVQDPDNLFV